MSRDKWEVEDFSGTWGRRFHDLLMMHPRDNITGFWDGKRMHRGIASSHMTPSARMMRKLQRLRYGRR